MTCTRRLPARLAEFLLVPAVALSLLLNPLAAIAYEQPGHEAAPASETTLSSESQPLAAITAPTRHEQTAAEILFTGWWTPWASPSLSGGDYAWTNGPGGTATFTFQGTRLEWFSCTAPSYGIAKVTVDGVVAAPANLYSATLAYGQRVWDSGTLPDGVHTVTVEWTGIKDTRSSGTFVGIDSVLVTGTLKPAIQGARVEQDDAGVSRAGSWNNWSSVSGLSSGMYSWTNSARGSATITFEGTRLDWITCVAPSYGVARVSVDGGTPQLVDLYRPQLAYQQNVWSTGVLPSGTHTVRIEWTGQKNASSGGTFIGMDALLVSGMLKTAPRVEQTDAAAVMNGAWTSWADARLSGGSYAWTNSAGGSVTLAFDGTRFDWLTCTAPGYGIARVRVDGGPAVLVDLYSPSLAFQRNVWSSGDLSSGRHTVTIEWTGTKNSLSSGTFVGADAFLVTGTVVRPVQFDRYEQQSDFVAYGGLWTSWASSHLSGGTYWWMNSAGSFAEFAFDGVGFEWITAKAPSSGKARVIVDGSTVHEVDLYSASLVYQQVVHKVDGLAPGRHTVRIEWTGAKNSASSGTFIGVDAIAIAGTPAMPLVQQSEARVAKPGTWTTWSDSKLSGGSYSYMMAAGAYAEVTFTGTKLDWITCTTPSNGIAEVTINGGTPVRVDLYSAEVRYQQTVWTTGTLPSGTHTVRIRYTGDKSASSSNAFVGVDAFRIDGVLKPAFNPVQETEPKFIYGGTWTTWQDARLSGGTYRWANAPASVTIEFEGRRFDWITCTNNTFGKASVSLDGAPAATVDLYSADLAFGQKVYSTGDLAPGVHTIKITWTGTKNPASSGTYVGVDRVDLVGAPRVVSGFYYITGRGWGHGIGMSQYGSRGFAEHGWGYRSILAHYYQGTGISKRYSSIQAGPTVFVNLEKDKTARKQWVIRSGVSSYPFTVASRLDLNNKVVLSGADAYIVETVSGVASVYKATGSNLAGWQKAGGALVSYWGGAYIYAQDPANSAFSLVELESSSGPWSRNGIRWRGGVEIRPTYSGSSESWVINHVKLDEYLYGVVPREMPSGWHSEALKVQAVAARSYGYSSIADIDTVLYCTDRSQVYNGHSQPDASNPAGETASTNAAVDATVGEYVVYGSSVVQTFFSSTSGGHTANIEDVWVNSTPQPYYTGVPDPYEVSAGSPYATSWPEQIVYSPTALATKLGYDGLSVVSVTVTERAASDHLVRLVVGLSDGTTRSLTGNTFRSRLGLRSTVVFIKKG